MTGTEHKRPEKRGPKGSGRYQRKRGVLEEERTVTTETSPTKLPRGESLEGVIKGVSMWV